MFIQTLRLAHERARRRWFLTFIISFSSHKHDDRCTHAHTQHGSYIKPTESSPFFARCQKSQAFAISSLQIRFLRIHPVFVLHGTKLFPSRGIIHLLLRRTWRQIWASLADCHTRQNYRHPLASVWFLSLAPRKIALNQRASSLCLHQSIMHPSPAPPPLMFELCKYQKAPSWSSLFVVSVGPGTCGTTIRQHPLCPWPSTVSTRRLSSDLGTCKLQRRPSVGSLFQKNVCLHRAKPLNLSPTLSAFRHASFRRAFLGAAPTMGPVLV